MDVTLHLTFTVSGTTPEDLKAHVEDIGEDICSLLTENLEQIAWLDSFDVTTNQPGVRQ